jgi:hypothetical protein
MIAQQVRAALTVFRMGKKSHTVISGLRRPELKRGSELSCETG